MIVNTGISKAIKDGNGNAIIFTALAAAAIANTLPTPFDAIYFSRQRSLKEKLENGTISIENYWYHDVGEYYLWTSLWYVSLFIGLSAVGGAYKNNSRALIALVGAGAVLGVIQKNIKKDKDIQSLRESLANNKNSIIPKPA